MKLLTALLTLLACLAPLAAQDLSKIDRTIAKEPVYQSKNVKYCLLVFGPEAKHRVWLVHDGEVLYVDGGFSTVGMAFGEEPEKA